MTIRPKTIDSYVAVILEKVNPEEIERGATDSTIVDTWVKAAMTLTCSRYIEDAFRPKFERLAREAKRTRLKTPHKEGHFWGKWVKKSVGTADFDDAIDFAEWEVMHVVDNNGDEADGDQFVVMVPGVEKFQEIDNFVWAGVEVPVPTGLEV